MSEKRSVKFVNGVSNRGITNPSNPSTTKRQINNIEKHITSNAYIGKKERNEAAAIKVANNISKEVAPISSLPAVSSNDPAQPNSLPSVSSKANAPAQATDVPDILYVTYQNKIYPVNVKSRTQQTRGGTRKHKSHRHKTRKH